MEFKYPFAQPIHPLAVEICRILQGAGYQAYIVGGSVRDLHLDIIPKDFDITTNATPEQVVQLFDRTIPTGLQHGTITVCMGEGIENHFEVTTFRIEGEYKDGRRPEEVKFVNNLTEDLARRDLTINAIAFDPVNNLEVDPFHGLQDIENKIIRAVGNPQQRFQEDGLRIMRVARFAARFGYTVAPATVEGMKISIDTLKKVSKERIKDELCKILMAQDPFLGLDLLKAVGALDIACPFLTSDPVLTQFLHEQNSCPGELTTRVAFLYGNCKEIARVAQELVNLKFSGKEIKQIVFLLDLLDEFEVFRKKNTSQAYVQFMALIKNYSAGSWQHTFEQFLQLTEAMGIPSQACLSSYQEMVVWARKELAVNGDNLLEIGVKSGPEMKKLLDNAYQQILEYPEHNNKEFLLELIKNKL